MANILPSFVAEAPFSVKYDHIAYIALNLIRVRNSAIPTSFWVYMEYFFMI